MKLIGYILFGLTYTIIYFFLAVMTSGGGHGNFIVFLPLTVWILNFAALFLLTKLKSKMIRIFFVVMMIVYYVVNFLILYPASQDDKMVTPFHAEAITLPAGCYILGQIIIWIFFFKEINNQKFND